MDRLSALEAVLGISDPDSFVRWEGHFGLNPGISQGYRDELDVAAQRTGSDESVLAGQVRVTGIPAAVLAWEFGFLGGSVGVNAAAVVVAGVRRATAQGLPLIVLPRSGGTRMQEGAPAFVQMVAIAAAVAEHRSAGLPYLVHLCNPTTGGVLATLGSAGDLTTAEPEAMVGFLGPRAYAAITGEQFPEGVQVAEHLAGCGIIDAVLTWPELRVHLAGVLRLWADRPGPGWVSPVEASDGHLAGAQAAGAPESAEQLWEYVQVSRQRDRLDAALFIAEHVTDFVMLPGTSAGERSGGALVGVGRMAGMPMVLAGTTDRRSGQPLTVGGLRTVRRGIDLAQRWGLPLVTVVDTLGAQLSVAGEQSGIAGEISRVMLDLVSARTPTAALLLGAGTGGAALALLAADRIIAGSHTWVAPLPPEGAAVIRHGGSHDPAQVAWEQRIGAHALADLGFIDHVVRESHPGWMDTAARAVVASLSEVLDGADPGLRRERFDAWLT